MNYRKWLYGWVERGADRYTFPDGTTLMLTDNKLPDYFEMFKDELQQPQYLKGDNVETDPVMIEYIAKRKLDLLGRL